MITAQRHHKMMTRNLSHFKKFVGESHFDSGSDSETDGDGEVTCGGNPVDDDGQPQTEVPRAYLQRQRSRPLYYHEEL